MAKGRNRREEELVVKWEHIDTPDAKQRILKAYELLLADLEHPQGRFDKSRQNRHDDDPA